MVKWLFEIAYAFALRKQMSISFWQALRFVRCDYLVQLEIDKVIGVKEDNSGKEKSNEE